MIIKGQVHCLFEQSGTFKNEFKKLGYNAYDYDIQNNFGETDFVTDLFTAIKNCYDGKESIFDFMSQDDLLIAFFPCIYFEAMQMTYYSLDCNNVRAKKDTEKVEVAIDRLEKRTHLHTLLYKLVWIAYKKKLRLVIENPATAPHYLITFQNFPKPSVVDKNRMERGGLFQKTDCILVF